jgi:hypothetical protein
MNTWSPVTMPLQSSPRKVDDDDDEDGTDSEEEYFDPENLTASKREWIDKQATVTKDLEWPSHIFDGFYVIVRATPPPHSCLHTHNLAATYRVFPPRQT